MQGPGTPPLTWEMRACSDEHDDDDIILQEKNLQIMRFLHMEMSP